MTFDRKTRATNRVTIALAKVADLKAEVNRLQRERDELNAELQSMCNRIDTLTDKE